MMMMSAAASFVFCVLQNVVSPRRSKDNSKSKGIRLLLGSPSKSKVVRKEARKKSRRFWASVLSGGREPQSKRSSLVIVMK
jgi:hypothetical protein